MQTEFPERYITLGLKIAYYRKKAGMTQEVLAERIGKSVRFRKKFNSVPICFSMWENLWTLDLHFLHEEIPSISHPFQYSFRVLDGK